MTTAVTQVGDRIWFVTFMQYELGYFDEESLLLAPLINRASERQLS